MLKGWVKGQKLDVVQTTVAAETIDWLTMEFEFDAAWEHAAKTAIIYREETEESYAFLLRDDKITEDMHLNLATGKWSITLIGTITTEAGVQRITTVPAHFVVKDNGRSNGAEMPEVAPTYGEQVVALAQAAEEKAQSVVDAAERGEFKGEKGDKGDVGPKGETGLQGLPGERGPQGEKGPQGERGETGPKGEAGADGKDGRDGAPGAQGPQGPEGPQGATGPAGSDAAVTPENIKRALGYDPADAANVPTKEDLSDLEQTHNADISALNAKDAEQDLEIKKLKAAAEGNIYMFQQDDAEAYEKPVPSDALEWATLDKVGGKTIVWNQIVKLKSRIQTVSGIEWTIDMDGTIAAKGTATALSSVECTNNNNTSIKTIAGHVYYLSGCPIGGSDATYRLRFTSGSVSEFGEGKRFVGADTIMRLNCQVFAGQTVDFVFRPQLFDLTSMFGAGNEPTAEQFRAMFPADYYPYSEPTLMTYSPESVVNKGTNLYNGTYTNIGYPGDSSATSEVVTRLFTEKIKVTTGEVLYGNISGVSPGDESLYFNRVIIFDNDGNFIQRLAITDGVSITNKPKFKYTIPEGVGYIMVDIRTEALNTILPATMNPKFMLSHYDIDYSPYFERTTDLHPLVQKYFPDGMKSAGDAHDEIDLERGVAIQRVGSVDMGTLPWGRHTYNSVDIQYPYFRYRLDDAAFGSTYITPHYLYSGVGTQILTSQMTIASYQTNQLVLCRNDSIDNVTAFKQSVNGDLLYYELATPIETPIDPADLEGLTELSVEAGGSLTFANQFGDDYRVPLPNQETWMIKLGGATT